MMCMILYQNTMPESRDDARQVLRKLGMDYNCIHACPNDCVLFRGEFELLATCPKCGADRYRNDLQGQTVPQKVLRHFPLIPRVRHIFRTKSFAKLTTWHAENRSTDGVQRTPADSEAWHHIDETFPDFAREARNLRFGLAMDGVNPFGLRSTSYSVWPVVLVNYNIPPWLSTKKGHLLLSLLVPGRYKVKNMDVYLSPLIDELKELWEGIVVEDMSKHIGRRSATIRAILMWTMHDFPGYGECSGKACFLILLVFFERCWCYDMPHCTCVFCRASHVRLPCMSSVWTKVGFSYVKIYEEDGI